MSGGLLLQQPRSLLSESLEALTENEAAAFVLERGSWFEAVPLPKGVKRRKPGNCYATAYNLAMTGIGFYVEGYALHPGNNIPIKHAWITMNGADAVDPSCNYSLECEYFGIPFSRRALSRLLIARNYHGHLDPIDDVLKEALMADPFQL